MTYQEEAERQKDPYAYWIRKGEPSPAPGEAVPMVLLDPGRGEADPRAEAYFSEYFREHPERNVLYGDEDLLDQGMRKDPWWKPDWSPDSFRSMDYLGLVAIRKSCLTEEELKTFTGGACSSQGFYQWLEQRGEIPYPIHRMVYHVRPGEWETMEKNIRHVSYPLGDVGISVIIPSKDNPEVLQRCLESIKEKEQSLPVEILVVDNGSCGENVAKVKKAGEDTGLPFQYIYRPEPFNFSHMCNLGAEAATNEVLLFLNDDTELETKNGLGILAAQALQKGCGAVGAKLLYPGDEERIQHCNVTNTRIGPVHKLQGMKDDRSHYHGRNRADQNALAVTGACLAISREHFHQMGGFCEKLPIAYNDIDLCFSLYEAGLLQVVRNDVVLLHFESFTRGSDDAPDKRRRLRGEMAKLYERHPALKGRDPFYNEALVQLRYESDYVPATDCDYEKEGISSRMEEIRGFKPGDGSRMQRMLGLDIPLMYNMERVDIMPDGEVRIEGWGAPLKAPAWDFERRLILEKGDGGKVLALEVYPKLRPDVAAILSEQPQGELAGFVARLRPGSIGDGDYALGIAFLKGKKRFYRRSERLLHVEGEDIRLV